jgi:tripartite ATP-independent transporter DctM subunit
MSALLLFGLFVLLLLFGAPIAVSMGLGAMAAIAVANADQPWWGLLAASQNALSGIEKYPLMALPMFVLVGAIFDRSGVAQRLVTFALACVGRGPGMLPLVAILVAMVLGGISGSSVANAAAVGGVMVGAMARAGYPAPFAVSVVGAAAATDVLIPPSIAFVVYSVIVPAASVPALFAAGMIPGILVGLALIVPAVVISRLRGFGAQDADQSRPPFFASLLEAAWGLAAPVLILGGMRVGAFTPTEAAVVAVIYGLFVGLFVHKTLSWRDLPVILRDAAEISAVVMVVIAWAGVFSYSVATLGLVDPLVDAIKGLALGSMGTLVLVLVAVTVVGTVLEGVPIFLIFLPLISPLMSAFKWDPVWFGVLLTMAMAIGCFTPPLGVNLLVTCRMAGVRVEQTIPWVIWLLVTFVLAMVAVLMWPALAIGLPRHMGF